MFKILYTIHYSNSPEFKYDFHIGKFTNNECLFLEIIRTHLRYFVKDTSFLDVINNEVIIEDYDIEYYSKEITDYLKTIGPIIKKVNKLKCFL